MEKNAFKAGVRPGGLLNSTQIKVLVCYILANLEEPFPRQDMQELFHARGYANYFALSEAISELTAGGNVRETDENGDYTITPSGREAAQELAKTLPRSLREGALLAAKDRLNQLEQSKMGNQVEIRESDGGFTVTCTVQEGGKALMQVSLWLPQLADAEHVRTVFLKDPSRVYSGIVSYLSEEKK